MGNMLAGVTSAYMCSIPIDNGWPFIFYVPGTGYNAVVVIPDVGVVNPLDSIGVVCVCVYISVLLFLCRCCAVCRGIS